MPFVADKPKSGKFVPDAPAVEPSLLEQVGGAARPYR